MFSLFRPRTLQWYILREFGTAFALALLACTLFMLLGTFFMMAADFEEYGITPGQIALLSPFILAKPLSYALPLAAMIGATMVFGRLCAENEIIAAQAGGAPIRVLVAPLLLCGVALSGVSLWCNDEGLRWGYRHIREEILKLDNPDFLKNLDKPGSSLTLHLDSGSVVRLNALPARPDPRTDVTPRPIHIAYFDKESVGQTILAEDHTYQDTGAAPKSGGERRLSLILYRAKFLGDRPAYADKVSWDFPLPDLSDQISIGNTRGQKGWSDNLRDARTGEETLDRRRRFLVRRAADFGAMTVAGTLADPGAAALTANAWNDTRFAVECVYGRLGEIQAARADAAEFHRKLALSFLPLSMVVLGAGLGLLVRKSQRLVGFLLGIAVYGLLYYPLTVVCKEMAISGTLGFAGLWLPNLFLLACGYVLWRFYERGWPRTLAHAALRALDGLHALGRLLWRPFETLRARQIKIFRRKTDNYVTTTFVVPLAIVVISMAGLFTALDLVEHGSEIYEGIIRAGDPLPGVAERTTMQACADVSAYYGIRTLEVLCDLMPLLVLLAGALCVTVLVRNQEHLILKSAGLALQRALRPVWVVALAVCVGVTVFRELVMPRLILRRDYLKPLVYRRAAAPSALALYGADAAGKPVLFEISNWRSAARSGDDLRVYLLGEARDRHVPTVKADCATWNGRAWRLEMDPMKHILERNATSGKSDVVPVQNIPRVPHGFLVRTELKDTRDPALADGAQAVSAEKTPLAVWRGNVTPAFIESERLGAGVMRLDQLLSASAFKPALRVDWWRRLSEFMMGVFLLWAALPRLLKEEARTAVLGLALAILFGAAYWGLNMAAAGAAREAYLPYWAPLLPHALFAVVGYRQYFLKMET